MIVKKNQNWRTSQQPWNLSLANSINTGATFNTPSNAIATTHAWASRGMQGVSGYGPLKQYGRGAGLDGMGCGGSCNCGCGGGSTIDLGTLLLLGAAAYFLFFRRERGAYE